jgi:hypothetical protein
MAVFVPAVYRCYMTEPLPTWLAIVATGAVMVAKAIAGAIAGRGASHSELAERLLTQVRDRSALGPGDQPD